MSGFGLQFLAGTRNTPKADKYTHTHTHTLPDAETTDDMLDDEFECKTSEMCAGVAGCLCTTAVRPPQPQFCVNTIAAKWCLPLAIDGLYSAWPGGGGSSGWEEGRAKLSVMVKNVYDVYVVASRARARVFFLLVVGAAAPRTDGQTSERTKRSHCAPAQMVCRLLSG